MNSERRTRRIDWRTSASASMKDSIAKAGATPVAAWSSARKPSSVSFCMPQSVWWISITSRVPSLRWEIASERITSSVMTPPALRRMCASPSPRPSAAKTSSRESMQVTIASRLARMQVEVARLQAVRVGPVVRQQLVDRGHGIEGVTGSSDGGQNSDAFTSRSRPIGTSCRTSRLRVSRTPWSRLSRSTTCSNSSESTHATCRR